MNLKDLLAKAPKKATWNLTDISLYDDRKFRGITTKYPKLSIILISDESTRKIAEEKIAEDATKFAKHLTNALPKYGFDTSTYQIVTVAEVRILDPKERRELLCTNLNNAHNTLIEGTGAPLVVVLMPGNDPTVFSDIK
jgi:hypothetical protein